MGGRRSDALSFITLGSETGSSRYPDAPHRALGPRGPRAAPPLGTRHSTACDASGLRRGREVESARQRKNIIDHIPLPDTDTVATYVRCTLAYSGYLVRSSRLDSRAVRTAVAGSTVQSDYSGYSAAFHGFSLRATRVS